MFPQFDDVAGSPGGGGEPTSLQTRSLFPRVVEVAASTSREAAKASVRET